MTASTDDLVHDPTELQQQLDEKDQLVLALTDRLEEAAEQLDRVQRSGGDKGGRVSGGGLSADAVAQQQTLIEQLGKTAELWEDVQPRDAFARIESQLDALRGLLEHGTAGRPSAAAPATVSAPPPSRSTEAPRQTAERGDDASQDEEPLSAWEKMKADLMGEESTAAPPPTRQPTAAPAPDVTPGPPQQPDPPAVAVPDETNVESLSEIDLPEPIDVDTAARGELTEGIESRDKYIGYLTRRLRSAESRTHQPIDWEQLNNAPEEMRETLQQLEADLVDRLRIAEVDLSLERARLSRVETRVRGMQKQVEKKLNSVAGKGPSEPSDPQETPQAAKRAKGWFGARGR